MIKRYISAFLTLIIFIMLMPCANAADYLLNIDFDGSYSPFLCRTGSVTMTDDSGLSAGLFSESAELRYTPQKGNTDWDTSYSMNVSIKMDDWQKSSTEMLIFRTHSSADDMTYIISYSANGFSLAKMHKPMKYVSLLGASGAVDAEPNEYHDIRIDTVNNDDGSVLIKVYFDGGKVLEYGDKTNVSLGGGVMVRNNMADSTVLVDSIRVTAAESNVKEADDAAAYDTLGTDYENASDVLHCLGIMDYDAYGLFNGDYYMTRSEFTDAVIRLLGCGDTAYNDGGVYTDISVSDKYGASVYTAYGLGLLSRPDDGLFRPDDAIVYDEAVKMLVCALGYGYTAQYNGGYPFGYLAAARSIGLLDGVSDVMTRGNSAVLLENALDVKLMKVYSVKGKNSYNLKEGRTILESREIYKTTGVVTDNGVSSLLSFSSLSGGRVKIDDVVFEAGNTSVAKYLGCTVKYYYKSDADTRILLYAKPVRRNEIISVNDEYISDTSDKTKLVYYNDGGKKESADISPIADFIYNGVAYPEFSDSDMTVENGSITLIDNNFDGLFDVVSVWEYSDMLAEFVSKSDNVIAGENKRLCLDADFEKYDIYSGGKSADIKAVSENTVVSYAVSIDKKYAAVHVSSDKITGKVTSVSEDKIEIDGKTVKLSKSFENNVASKTAAMPKAGKTYTLYLNFAGRLAAVKEGTASNQQYGFLRNVGFKPGISGNVEMEIYTQNGVFEIFPLCDRVSYDGKTVSDDALASNGVFSTADNGKITSVIPQLISYSTDADGKIREIKAAKTGLNENLSPGSFIKSYDGSGTFFWNNKSFNSKYFIENTPVFVIPVSQYESDDLYRIVNYNYFINMSAYDITCYNVRDGVPDIMAVNSTGTYNEQPNETNSVMLIDKVTAVFGADGDERAAFCGMYRGEYTAVTARSGLNLTAYKPGDAVQLLCGSNGNILSVSKALSNADSQGFYQSCEPGNTARFVFGRIVKYDTSHKKLVLNISQSETVDDTSLYVDVSPSDIIYYKYYSGKKLAESAAEADLLPGECAFVRLNQERCYEIIIYK